VIVTWPVLAVPVPVNATFCGLPLPLSVKLSNALRVPAAVGLNVTEAEQLDDAARLAPHVLLAIAKSPAFVPEIPTLLIVIADDVPFVNVADCAALVAPTVVLANVRPVGLADTLPDPPVPSPVSATLCGLLVAESLNTRVAARFPMVVGAKTIVAVQLADAASEDPHVLLLIRKSPGFVPDIAMLLIVIVLVPLFVSVTGFGPPLLPTATFTQFKLVGETLALPEPDTPVPESVTFCGLLLAPSAKLSVADRAPDAPGLNVIDTVQLAELPRLLPQVLLEMAKSPAFVPEIATLLIAIDDDSPFVSVVDFAALVDPTVTLPNAIDVGLTETVPLAETPVPVSATVPAPEPLKFIVALRVPVAVGAKTTFTVQLDDAASDVPHVLLKTLKSPGLAPVNVMLLIVIAEVLVLERVTTLCPLVFPSATVAHVSLVGDTETAARQFAPCNAPRAIAHRTAALRQRLAMGAPMRLRTSVRTTQGRLAQRLAGSLVFIDTLRTETLWPEQKGKLHTDCANDC